MWLATGDNNVAVCGVEVCSKHRLVGALDRSTWNKIISLLWEELEVFEYLHIKKVFHTLTSASLSSLCQSQTERTWSLESSTTHSVFPPFWQVEKHTDTWRARKQSHRSLTVFIKGVSGLFLPTWRKTSRPSLGRRSPHLEHGGCWGWQSPTLEREEPAAVKEKTHTCRHTAGEIYHQHDVMQGLCRKLLRRYLNSASV